jgi:hypothetical protein
MDMVDMLTTFPASHLLQAYSYLLMFALKYSSRLRSIETIPGMEGRGIKEDDVECEFNYDIL